MYYKISNTSSGEILENTLDRPLKYPHLYEKQIMVNGFGEASIPIVPMQESDVIVPAIWGILPEGYHEDWSTFQNICNTLNAPLESINTHSWYSKSLQTKRCLIPVTGFFTSYVSNGLVYPFYISRTNGLPFCFAGIYNKTDDGFLSCSIITCKANDVIGKVHNVGQTMPVILSEELQSEWLQEDKELNEIKEILNTPYAYQIKSHPIAREFYKNNITYDSILEPVFYEDIPTGIF